MRKLSASPALACAILVLPLVVPLLKWQILPFGDIAAFQVPMRSLYQQTLRAGDSFLWSSALGSGLYLHAEGQTGMAHPAHLLMYRFLPLTLAINLEMLGSIAAAAAGLWLLLRRLGIRGDASLGGALVFAFGGYMLPHLNQLTPIVVAAHAPWVVLAADRLLRGTGRAAAAGFAGAALTLGSQVLLGYPQVVWMTAVILGWFVVYRMIAGTKVSRVALLVVALLCGLAIGGVQLLPTLDAARESFRSATTMAFRMSFSLHPLNIVQLFSPYAFKDGVYAASAEEWFPHELSLYAGALATMSVTWVMARRRSLADRGLATAFLWLAAIGFVLALGQYGGLYPLLAKLPVLSSFRASARHILIVHFAFAGLVALTLQDLLDRPAGAPVPRWPLAVPAIVSVALTAVALLAQGSSPLAGRPVAALGGLAFAVLTALCIWLAARGSRHAVSALVLVMAVDLACRGLPFVYEEAPKPIALLEPSRGRPPGSEPGDLVHPAQDLGEMNRFVLARRRSQLAYLGLVRSSVLDPDALVTQRLAGVKWTWTAAGWAPVERTMPRVRLVTDWRVSRDVPSDLGGIDIARTALVDGPPGAAAAEPGEARMIEERAGRFRIDTRADAEQLLVLTERFHDGWTATVDGRPVSTRRIYGDYLGCLVPAGSHVVTFVFAPATARYGLWLTLAGLALTAAGCLILLKLRA